MTNFAIFTVIPLGVVMLLLEMTRENEYFNPRLLHAIVISLFVGQT